MATEATPPTTPLAERFRGFLPVVVDVETGGFDAARHALLEAAAVLLDMDDEGRLRRGATVAVAVAPHPATVVEPAALTFTGIDPGDPERGALPESEALQTLFRPIRQAVRAAGCSRAVVVGHNAHFDLAFLNAAAARSGVKRNPFHPFSCLDTATLAALAFGHTVLARACERAGIPFDPAAAHRAAYDAERTADLFCLVVNRWRELGGWPPR
ncbi:MAG: ribonuclease T [Porticoccaceae bacterium]|nr:MAG: ribonuclease T [Porticoccaceae bacterium]